LADIEAVNPTFRTVTSSSAAPRWWSTTWLRGSWRGGPAGLHPAESFDFRW